MSQCQQQPLIEVVRKFCSDHELLFIQQQQKFLLKAMQTLNESVLSANNRPNNPNNPKPQQNSTSKNAIKKPTQTDPKVIVNAVLNLESKLKYPIALLVVFLLTKNKEKPLSIILGFYYEIVNHLVKELKKNLEEDRKNANKKIDIDGKEKTEQFRRICTDMIVDGFRVILLIQQQVKPLKPSIKQTSPTKQHNQPKQPKQLHPVTFLYQTLAATILQITYNQTKSSSSPSIKPSKLIKIICSILCIPQEYLPPSCILESLLELFRSYSQSEEVLAKIEYKLVKKLEIYKESSFEQKDVVGLLKIILLNRFQNPKIEELLDEIFDSSNCSKQSHVVQGTQSIRPRHSLSFENNEQQQNGFLTQSKKKKNLKLIDIVSSSLTSKSSSINQPNKPSYGYHLTCFIVKIISTSQRFSSTQSDSCLLFMKQLIIYLSTIYLHQVQSFSSEKQSIKFYNTIIGSLINENNILILKVCLNFMQNEVIMEFSVDKLKSLFKLLTNIAKKLKKIDSNQQKSNKSIKSSSKQTESKFQKALENGLRKEKQDSETLVNEEVELAKLKISRIIRIFEELTQRYRDKCQQILFVDDQESTLTLEKIKESNSVAFSFRLNDLRKSYPETKSQSDKTKFPKPFVQLTDQIRLVKFIIGKSETYEIYMKVKPSQISGQSPKSTSFSFGKCAKENNFFNQLLQAQSSYTIDLVVCLDQKILLQDQIKNVERVAESYFELMVLISCNKSTQQKGSKLLIKINEKLIEISSKQKRNQITSFEFGLQRKTQESSLTLSSSVKNLFFFSKQIPEKVLQKHDFSTLNSPTSHLINLLTSQSVTYRIHESPQLIIEDLKDQPKLFFKKELKINANGISKSRTLSFIEVFQQMGGLNSIFYMLDKINNSYACHFGQKTQHFFVQIFKILKNLAANDRQNFIFKQVKHSYEYICHFLFLIFRRNEHLANQRNCHFVDSIFKFLMYFSTYFTKDLTIRQYPVEQVFEMELIFIKEVLCHFELWSECSLEIQSYVFETLQNFIKNDRFTFSLFSIDLHSKILSSMTFFYCHEINPLKNKFEQRILILCEHLYDKVYQLLDEKSTGETVENLELLLKLLNKIGKDKSEVGLVMKKNKEKSLQKRNEKRTTKGDLLLSLENYIHRDVNQVLSLIYLLIVYHSKHFSETIQRRQESGLPSTLPNNSVSQQKLHKSNIKNPISSFVTNLNFSGSKSTVSSNHLSSAYLPAQLKTCMNLLSYFMKNFVDKDHVFTKINDDWAYVISIIAILQQILLQTKIKAQSSLNESLTSNSPSSCQTLLITKLYELLFKILVKKPQFYTYLINSLQKLIMHPNTIFIQSFYFSTEILHLNKRFNFDIIDSIFFLLNKKLNSFPQKQKKKQILQFFNETDLEKMLYKMANAALTYSREFDEFLIEIMKIIGGLEKDCFAEQTEVKESFIFEKTQNFQKKHVPIVINESSQIIPEPKSEETIIDQFLILQKENSNEVDNFQMEEKSKILKSRQAVQKIFSQYDDTLFSICYQTSFLSQQNRQWLESYLTKKYKNSIFNSSNMFSFNFLKEKRINFDSNFKIGHFCSSQSTVYFMLNVLERLCQQQKLDALDQQAFQKNGLKKELSQIRQSPSKQNSNSVSSRTIDHAEFFIETQQKINQQISSLISRSQPISFFLSNQKLSILSIHIFFTSLQQFERSSHKYSFFSHTNSISLLVFVKLYAYGRALKYLLEKYSYNDQTQNEVQKPIDAMRRKENTLKVLNIFKNFYTQNQIDFQGLYNCLLPQGEINLIPNTKFLLAELPSQKTPKVTKDIQISLKKFLESWYMNNNKAFKINPHDREKLKVPKKLNLQEKNLYDVLIDKMKYVCLDVQKEEQKVSEVFSFFNEQTKGGVARQFLPLINKIISTLKYVLEAKNVLTILQNPSLFTSQFVLMSCPKNPSAALPQKIVAQYSQILIQKFNKILLNERKKAEKSQSEFRKNQKENQFWLEIEDKDCDKKDKIFQLDEKEVGPFGFYKLNIKPAMQSVEQIHYPRKKMFASIKNSQTSGDNEQQDNGQGSILLSRTRVLDLSFIDGQNAKQRRNTLLEITPIMRNQTQNVENSKNPANINIGVFWCQMVTKRGVYAGKLLVKNEYLEFKYCSHLRLPDEPVYRLSTGKFHQINSLTQEQQTRLSSLKIPYKRCRLFTRRYILRHTAIQLFSKSNHQSYFFNLFWPHERVRLLNQARQKFQECLEDKKQQFVKRQFTEQWKIGVLSNFEYLCLVNQYSGRSTNDLAQYYVLPWVITNYNGKNGFRQLDEQFLKHKENLRNLANPPGKLNQEKFMKLKTRLMELDFCQPEDRFLYGTMFSNPTVLYNFFIRLQPYIHLHWQHQGKRIDHADRLFSSIQEQFSSVLIASSDMKELTPEFYYWPQFLKNRSYIDLGQKQNKQEVDDVILPVWAHSPQEFIFKMRYVLESNVISEHLHEWIDLTFGYKIKYENAEENDNLYHFNCYERQNDYFEQFGNDEKQIRSLQVSISQFGQIPQALFNEPHPSKNLRHDFLIIDRFVNVKYEKPNLKLQKNLNKIGFQTCRQGIFVWTSSSVQFKKSYITQNYSYDQEHKILPSCGEYSRLLSFDDQCWLTLNQGILRIYIKKVLKFEQSIEADCIDILGTYFIFAKKSSICITQYDSARNQLNDKKVLYGHKDEIIHISCSKSLDLILSIDLYGFAILHEMQDLAFLRNFQLPLEKQWSRESFSKQSSNKHLFKVQIHEMGYFVFLLNQKKLVIVTQFLLLKKVLG